ncbi:MAG: ribonuclease HI family protein [Candidatus Micrarchaeia archaeon]|jgi:ribonuclease HI
MKFYVYTDGASRGNPGSSASGYIILDSSGKIISKEVFYNGVETNNFAEYMAIVHALEKIAKVYGYENEVELTSDSELAIKQINGLYKVKNKRLKALNQKVVELSKKFKKCSFTNARRENKYISIVDRELNKLLDRIEDSNLNDKKYTNNKQLKL